MKRIGWLLVAFLLLFGGATFADDATTNTASFTNLQQAIVFIANALESTNFIVIRNACLDAQCHQRDYESSLAVLQKLNCRTPLVTAFAKSSFPTNGSNIGLAIFCRVVEPSAVHIDFVRTNEVWRIQGIRMGEELKEVRTTDPTVFVNPLRVLPK
jgi:hypothetical protein